MISRRSIVLALLIVMPLLIYAVIGGYAIWKSGSFGWIWWLMPACGLTAWILSILWKPARPSTAKSHQLTPAKHWTPRDEEAAKIVRRYQESVETHSLDDLIDPHFYLKQIESLAMDLVPVYHKSAANALESLTVPEVLAATRLAVDDLEHWMLVSVPGSRMLTIRQWRLLASAPGWLQTLSNAAWIGSILLNPANIARYAVSKWTWNPVAQQLQSEVLAVAYLRFIRQTGFYLIEMNSGRLRGGADQYRATFESQAGVVRDARTQVATTTVHPATITISLIGQVSSGKSSLVNLLTGDHQATVDVLPETRNVQRYRCRIGDPPVEIQLLDTPGYGESGASAKQIRQIHKALEESDAALLVMDGHSPAREPDRITLAELDATCSASPHLKPPAIAAVLTHIDLLPPPLEWSPPYDWRSPDTPKEQNIYEAVTYVHELFGHRLVDTVPVCSDQTPERQWGLDEELLPVLSRLLDDAHCVALLRAFEEQLNRDRWKNLLRNVATGARDVVRVWIEERLSPDE